MTRATDPPFAYHEASKHHVWRFAPSPGGLDWANQPDPFRRYAGAPHTALPLLSEDLEASYDDLHEPGAVEPRPLDATSIGLFFQLALGLTAWKEFRGARWALRANPSSGNLHPTEGYALLPACPGVGAGLYHYLSVDHLLEQRASLAPQAAAALGKLLPGGAWLAGLTSIHWREAWKYGVRAFRYCQHDAGHAIAALRYAAAALGWRARLLTAPGDTDVAALLGLDRDSDFASVAAPDREEPDALLLVAPAGVDLEAAARRLAAALDELGALIRGGAWTGVANVLSPDHVPWQEIGAVAEATRKPRGAEEHAAPLETRPPLLSSTGMPATRLMRQRRSAVEMDGATSIEAAVLYRMLDHLLPRPGVPPCDALPWRPRIHVGLFVHRVQGLEPGLYFLERDATPHAELRAAMRREFVWERPAGCPEPLRLFLLLPSDARSAAQLVSCHQAIAAEGAFSLGMLAEFRSSLERKPWWYRRLFWEAGVLGQALYLEAEAAGVRSTGIGCYFDDAFHGILGLADDRFQDLYHFTVGGPLEDARLTTLAPYGPGRD